MGRRYGALGGALRRIPIFRRLRWRGANTSSQDVDVAGGEPFLAYSSEQLQLAESNATGYEAFLKQR